MKKIAVVYHGECHDGFGGAWAAWKKFGARADYIPAFDRENPPSGLRGKTVYFIDWVYPLETMRRVRRAAKRVVAIDHHRTAEEACKAMDESVFDNSHSGAVLAWRYFHPGKPVPRLLLHIEDFDIWKWKLPRSKEIGAALEMTPFDFKTWNRLVPKFENPVERRKFIEKGELILKYQEVLIEEVVQKAVPVLFEGHKVLAANCPILHSEVGNLLALRRPPFGIVWWAGHPNGIKVSLRSARGFDISRFAVKYGGGGHLAAAGFVVAPGKKLPWKNL